MTPVRRVRRTLGFVAAAVLLAVAAVTVATLLINPDDYRTNIEAAVQRETGRPLALEGHLQLTWFPWLGVRTGAARLGNPSGAGGPALLDWQSAQVRVRLLPLLLHRQLEVARIRIVGADVHLRRNADGTDNWDDLIARLHSGSSAQPARSPTWGGLDLTDSSLDYADERSGAHVSITGWQLGVGPWSTGEPLSLSTSFLVHGHTAGTGSLPLPTADVHVALDVPSLQINTTRPFSLELAAPRLSLRIADAKLQGSLDAHRDASGNLRASGSLTAAAASLRGLIRALGSNMPLPTDPATLGALSLSGAWSYASGALDVRPLTARLDATTLTGWAARSSGPRPLWTFALRADQVDFDRYVTESRERKASALPVSALQALHAQGTLELARAQIDGATLEDVRLNVQ
ncbi:MAG TPA: AsmA family protein [Steroidobacteraceae bacterium]|nr:AsmA family protein [Steroidobacteraceae bacterium]